MSSASPPSPAPFWGARNTNIRFCEPPYHRSRYVAEFYNAWTNLFSVGGAIYALCRVFAARDRFFNEPRTGANRFLRPGPRVWCLHMCACMSFLVMGAGSFLLHATQRYLPELVDEAGLLLVAYFCLLSSADLHAAVSLV